MRAMHVKNWLVHRIGDRALGEALSAHASGLLLDIGCGRKPHARLTRGLVSRHVGIDHPGSLHGSGSVDAAASALRLPFRDDGFDNVLCVSVLEHLEEPEQALREAFRVLKPGGIALYMTPFLWHVHEEPRDFQRYSRYGLEHLFGKTGFADVEVTALSGFWVTFGQLFVHQLYRLHRGPLRWFPVIPAAGMLIQLAAYALEKLDRFPGSRKWTWAYLTLARKPGPTPTG
jgi:SAM-dependent methyltransferase